MKGTMLITAHAEPVMIKDTVEEIVTRMIGLKAEDNLAYTVINTKKNEEYKAGCLAGLYRGVREVEMPEPKEEKKK